MRCHSLLLTGFAQPAQGQVLPQAYFVGGPQVYIYIYIHVYTIFIYIHIYIYFGGFVLYINDKRNRYTYKYVHI